MADTLAPAGDVLVVLALRGGFDGLSAVAPVGDPAYAVLRPTIEVPTARRPIFPGFTPVPVGFARRG